MTKLLIVDPQYNFRNASEELAELEEVAYRSLPLADDAIHDILEGKYVPSVSLVSLGNRERTFEWDDCFKLYHILKERRAVERFYFCSVNVGEDASEIEKRTAPVVEVLDLTTDITSRIVEIIRSAK